jgi:hypothetical protein
MIDEELVTRCYNYLIGTTGDARGFLDANDIEDVDPEELEEAVEDRNLERCSGCDWWMESHELIDDDGEVVGCRDCRPSEEEDE